jgi:2-polyprenyl-3-methyl-5-hydroxy-6-metoxy-1,4-benzoquinol methylase
MALDDYALAAQAITFSALENQHDKTAAEDYWGKHYFSPYMREALGTDSNQDFQYDRIAETMSKDGAGRRRILSIGAGECVEEIAVCQRLVQNGFRNFRFECVDIASGAIERARAGAKLHGLEDYFQFEVGPNDAVLHGNAHTVIANQCLHHFTDLEDLFDRIKEIIGDNGIFVTNDMIGRNGHMLWPEALAVMDKIWQILPSEHKFNHVLGRHEDKYSNWDNSKENNEGIRAQDILPELIKRFDFDYFFAGGNLGIALFGRHFGANFDPAKDGHLIDMVGRIDNDLLNIGYLKPCLMTACMSNKAGPTRCYKHWTPEFCVRTESPFDHVLGGAKFSIGEPIEFSERKPGAECLR